MRCGARGYGDGLMGGCVIGLPPVLNFGNPEVKAKVVPEVLSGKKYICLAVSCPDTFSQYLSRILMFINKSLRFLRRTQEVMSLGCRPPQRRPRMGSIGLSMAQRNGSRMERE